MSQYPKILLFGATGQVGKAITHAQKPVASFLCLDSQQANFCVPGSLEQIISSFKPDIIINAAAYTAVDKAEKEVDLARQINSVAIERIAAVAPSYCWIIHYSTDYVFDGKKLSAYLPSDAPAPLNVYGQTKLAGEQALIDSERRFIILRTSWVYSQSGACFPKSILKLAQEREILQVVGDQIGTPTSANLIAAVTLHIIQLLTRQPERTDLDRIYHLVPKGDTSWYEYANFVIDYARSRGMSVLAAKNIIPVLTKDYSTLAQRPLNSRLDSSTLEEHFELTLPDWTVDLKQILQLWMP